VVGDGRHDDKLRDDGVAAMTAVRRSSRALCARSVRVASADDGSSLTRAWVLGSERAAMRSASKLDTAPRIARGTRSIATTIEDGAGR
jgi:hypothetical protein